MNRNISDVGGHANTDVAQEIIKEIEKILECKPACKGNVKNLREAPQGKSSQESKGRKGTIINKYSEKLEDMDEDKELEDIENDCSKKIMHSNSGSNRSECETKRAQ